MTTYYATSSLLACHTDEAEGLTSWTAGIDCRKCIGPEGGITINIGFRLSSSHNSLVMQCSRCACRLPDQTSGDEWMLIYTVPSGWSLKLYEVLIECLVSPEGLGSAAQVLLVNGGLHPTDILSFHSLKLRCSTYHITLTSPQTCTNGL